jgi:hypothetical protein
VGAAVADHPVDRRADFGVAEIERSQIALGLGLRQRGFDLPLFAIDDVELALRRLRRGLRLALGGDGFLEVGVGLFETLDRGKADGAQRAIAVEIVLPPRAPIGRDSRDRRASPRGRRP